MKNEDKRVLKKDGDGKNICCGVLKGIRGYTVYTQYAYKKLMIRGYTGI
jgi:hypothetical protein